MTPKETIYNNDKPIENTGFMPFHKIKKILPIGKKTKIGTPKRPTDNIKEYLNQLNGNQTIDETDWTPIKKQLENINEKGNEWQEEPPKEPILILIRSGTNKGEIYENMKAGNLKIKRTDKKDALIKLNQNKLISFEWGANIIRGWICHEDDTIPYPHEPEFDSAMVVDQYETALLNKKDYKAQQIKAYEGLAWAIGGTILLGAILIFWLLPMVGINILEQPKNTTTTDTNTTTQPTTNNNTEIINISNLTPEQQQKIKEITGG